MSCDACREHLLEAPPAEIRAALQRGEGELAAHLIVCAACRGLAEGILRQSGELANGLAALRPRGDHRSAAREALAESTRRGGGGRGEWPWLAAAAVLAGLLATRVLDTVTTLDDGDGTRIAHAPPVLSTEPTLEVEPLGDESVAVFETNDPDIIVLWFYQGRGQ